ncbi:MAG: DUF262 domain-containing HNH endonuclease family protein [Bacteroidales bacterium]|jgi:uncharacterized protein with ParB-like and HNH nuclease domain|nr:DUF262 domain-containing HNH endonuclease family protein [Bacteroidales bacterium]
METNNLGKNISTILQNKYVVPLYQRNFAWEDEEISQLLQDIYESFKKAPYGNYYIGSLVVIKRKNGNYEVIDGQQRLTAITLISKVLDSGIKDPKLFYDSRPEVEAFFNSFYQTGQTNDVTFDYKVSHLINAIDYINNAKLNSEENIDIKIKSLGVDFDNFKSYFLNNVVLVFVELPTETDVASYFEIMNNRGQQLQKQEILKAKLLDKIKKPDGSHDTEKQKVYSNIWDACSQMNIHIQKLFESAERKVLFDENYDALPNKTEIEKLLPQTVNSEDTQPPKQQQTTNFSIDSILSKALQFTNKNNNQNNEDIEEDESDDKSIIDFPNFLMHIMKLKYTSYQENNQKKEIQLNERFLLDTYDKIENQVNVEDFIADLLYYRTIFDKYVVKATTDENTEDKYEWTLKQAYKSEYTDKDGKKKTSLKYKNTFGDQELQNRIIKCLSMLQVTFRTRIYKNWLQEVLKWFTPSIETDVLKIDYRKKLDDLVLSYYADKDRNFKNEIDNVTVSYAKGTDTPHFLFNFIDYLYWIANKTKYNESKQENEKIANLDNVIDFNFNYRNSVEHHLPQSFEGQTYAKILIDNLGNLCLVSKSANSRMNNESPKGKADKNGKYYKDKLTPKRKIMYDMTNTKNEWGQTEIDEHYKDVVKLLKRRTDILK